MSESKTTSEWNWKVIRDGENGRRGALSPWTWQLRGYKKLK